MFASLSFFLAGIHTLLKQVFPGCLMKIAIERNVYTLLFKYYFFRYNRII